MHNKKLEKMNRQMLVMSVLNKVGYGTREHLQKSVLHCGERSANIFLKNMEDEGWIQSFVHEVKKIYYLTKQGRDFICSDKEWRKPSQVDHALMKTDIYLYFECPGSWEVERPISYDRKENLPGGGKRMTTAQVVPDARFELDGQWYLVEVDRMQSMKENKEKLKRYAELQQLLSPVPLVVFYTVSPARKEHLTEMYSSLGVDGFNYTKADLI